MPTLTHILAYEGLSILDLKFVDLANLRNPWYINFRLEKKKSSLVPSCLL